MLIQQLPVIKYAKGRDGNKIQGIVIHVAEGTRNQVYQTFQTEDKSSHYLCNSDGSVWQFVFDEDTAWHAGKVVRPVASLLMQNSSLNPNLYTLGIENEGMADTIIPEIQYQMNAELVESLCSKHDIPLDNLHIFGHRMIRADKTCPGKVDTARIVRMAQKIREDRTREATPEEEAYYKGVIKSLIERILAILTKNGIIRG